MWLYELAVEGIYYLLAFLHSGLYCGVKRVCVYAGLAWHPESMLGASLESVNLATGSADSTAKLWSMEGKFLSTLSGHTDR